MNLFVGACMFFCLIALGYGGCPYGWEHEESSCYMISRNNASYIGSQVICETYNSSLAIVDSQVEQFYLQYIIEKKYPLGDAWWIAGNDISVEGKWVWLKTWKPMIFNNWADGDPDNADGFENCVTMRRDDDYDYFWTDDPCGEYYNFICEKSATTSTTTSATTVQTITTAAGAVPNIVG